MFNSVLSAILIYSDFYREILQAAAFRIEDFFNTRFYKGSDRKSSWIQFIFHEIHPWAKTYQLTKFHLNITKIVV